MLRSPNHGGWTGGSESEELIALRAGPERIERKIDMLIREQAGHMDEFHTPSGGAVAGCINESGAISCFQLDLEYPGGDV